MAFLSTLVLGCNYSHIAYTNATLASPVTESGSLVLKINRHVDTVVKGPDIEEDQVLVITVHNVALNKKLLIPSDDVTADFTASRFGPSSKGDNYQGYLILNKVTKNRVEATVYLDLVARTESREYSQTEKYRGKYEFLIGEDDNGLLGK